MNDHVKLLELLEKYQGGKFRPQSRGNSFAHRLAYQSTTSESVDHFHWRSHGLNGKESFWCGEVDGNIHVEHAAWKAVREWCKNRKCDFEICDHFDRVRIYYRDDFYKKVTIGKGLADAESLLAALTYIMEQEKA